MSKIVVVDYGMGNLRSVAQALRRAAPDADILVSGDIAQVKAADRLVLPGQGAMPDCVRCLDESGLRQVLLEAAASKPLMGICVGEQLLFDHSEESSDAAELPKGLGLFPGEVVRFQLAGKLQPDGSAYKIPQMGWNRVWQTNRQTITHPMWQGIADGSYFYFVHSYYAVPDQPAHIAAETEYGIRFTCAVARDNIFATQFHPEKSTTAGLQLFKNFVDWQP